MIDRSKDNDAPRRGSVVTPAALSGLASDRPNNPTFNLEFVRPDRLFLLEFHWNRVILNGKVFRPGASGALGLQIGLRRTNLQPRIRLLHQLEHNVGVICVVESIESALRTGVVLVRHAQLEFPDVGGGQRDRKRSVQGQPIVASVLDVWAV